MPGQALSHPVNHPGKKPSPSKPASSTFWVDGPDAAPHRAAADAFKGEATPIRPPATRQGTLPNTWVARRGRSRTDNLCGVDESLLTVNVALDEFGISQVQITEFVPDTLANLGEVLS